MPSLVNFKKEIDEHENEFLFERQNKLKRLVIGTYFISQIGYL
jgi:hypothetical protein